MYRFYDPIVGGMETTVSTITEKLNKKGIKCDILCSNTECVYKEEMKNGYNIYKTKCYGIFASTPANPQLIWKLKEIVDNYDIIHVHHPDPMANLALFLINPKRQKVVLHYQADIVKLKFLLRLYKPLLIWMLRRADVIIGTSLAYAKGSPYLRKFLNKVQIVPLGVSQPSFDPLKTLEIRNTFKNKRIVFFLGRLVYYKGLEYLIEAAQFLDQSYVILIGGDGPEKRKLMKLAERFENKVIFLGKIPPEEVGSYYQACDIFCLPSVNRAEAFSIVLIEAMSFGKPLLATKIPHSGVTWVNQEGVSGFNVEPKDPRALANAIRTVCENKELYEKLSRNALERYRSLFTAEHMVDTLIDIYRGLLGT